jgi:hypothetical protein
MKKMYKEHVCRIFTVSERIHYEGKLKGGVVRYDACDPEAAREVEAYCVRCGKKFDGEVLAE